MKKYRQKTALKNTGIRAKRMQKKQQQPQMAQDAGGLGDGIRTMAASAPLVDPAVAVAMNGLQLAKQGGRQPYTEDAPLIGRPNRKLADEAILRRNLLRRIRFQRTTPRALSLEAGLNADAVRHVIIGRIKNPRADSMRSIADALNCNVEDLTGDAWFRAMLKPMEAELRIELGWMFMKAEHLRDEADSAADTETRKAIEHRANKLDFIDGPYEWDDPLLPGFEGTPGFPATPSLPPNLMPAPPGAASYSHFPSSPNQGRMLPIYAAAQGGTEGSYIMDWSPVEYKRAPEPLETVRDAFGFIVVDDSMFPAFEHGDIVFPHPNMRPTPGRNAIFIKRDTDGSCFVLLKRLESVSDSEWRVRQFNPERKFTLKRSEWQQCLIVTAKYERQ